MAITRDEILLNRFKGSLIGLAIGDAMGMPIEFYRPGTFEHISGYKSGGYFDLPKGCWTDDTSLALCLADSLIRVGYQPKDQMMTYCRWWSEEAYMSCNGEAIGLGQTTGQALDQFKKTGNPYSGPESEYSAGNGSIMRLAPVPLYFFEQPAIAIEYAGDSSRTTHGAITCIDACRLQSAIMLGALHGKSKIEILSYGFNPISKEYWFENPLSSEIEQISQGSFKEKQPPEIVGSGYVVKTLEAALWAFYHTDTFAEGLLKVVNLGDDADTTGAVFGQIAGVYYGLYSIPTKWKTDLRKYQLLSKIAEDLYNSTQSQ